MPDLAVNILEKLDYDIDEDEEMFNIPLDNQEILVIKKNSETHYKFNVEKLYEINKEYDEEMK